MKRLLPPSVSSTSDTQKTEKERQLDDGRGGGRGAKSYDGEKTFINHLILSGTWCGGIVHTEQANPQEPQHKFRFEIFTCGTQNYV
jgi:hypothetical protein